MSQPNDDRHQRPHAPPDPLHHRQRRLRAFQLLRHAQHPDALPDLDSLLLFLPEAERTGEAKHVFHTFVIGVYFFPLLGGWLADRFFGKYNTVLWLSLVYCAGHACLAAFEDNVKGFYLGLFLIALGSGGIKPLVSSFVGDQFDQTNKDKAKLVFDAFYWIINFGSFFASLLMPIFLRDYGASVAFGIPGILMLIATLVFWSGRKKYVHVPPSRRRSALLPARRAQRPAGAPPGPGPPGPGRGRRRRHRRPRRAGDGAVLGLRDRRLHGAGAAAGLRRHRRRHAAGARARHASRRSGRRRAQGAAHPDRVRAGHAVLVAVRPEGLDLDRAGQFACCALPCPCSAPSSASNRRRCRP
jgi:hypothetical protein